jgi:hypothetical protein
MMFCSACRLNPPVSASTSRYVLQSSACGLRVRLLGRGASDAFHVASGLSGLSMACTRRGCGVMPEVTVLLADIV